MRQMTVKVSPGLAVDLGAVGDYVRIKAALVSVRIESPDNGEFLDLEEGDSARLTRFERLRISHSDAADQSVVLLIGNGTMADSSKIGGSIVINSGNVTVDGEVVAAPKKAASAHQHTAKTVTTASSEIAAANASRSYLFVQNKSATGSIWININATAATTGNGIKIPPGGFYESSAAWCSTAAVRAIGDIASNPDVLVVEGN